MNTPTDWRCWIGIHRWTPWQEEATPSPYKPKWALSWRVCRSCDMWEWKPSRRERVTQITISALLLFVPLAWFVIGLVKFVEWIA